MSKVYSKIDRRNVYAARIYFLTTQYRMINTENKFSKQENKRNSVAKTWNNLLLYLFQKKLLVGRGTVKAISHRGNFLKRYQFK